MAWLEIGGNILLLACILMPLSSDAIFVIRKFGKYLQKRQLDIPEYAASFVNYKGLKKVRQQCVSPSRSRV